ncbi:DUF6005 family protein [Paenibacillus sp. strain BS8-2]
MTKPLQTAGSVLPAEEVSIKVHCIVSCFCEVLRQTGNIDYRPFYFGVWDADIDYLDDGSITYYQHDLRHDYFTEWYERLFGVPVRQWYDTAAVPSDNLDTLIRLVEQAPSNRHVIAQLDMSLLPEYENKFKQKPFPHFVMLYRTDNPDQWYLRDPDFRREGVISRDRALEAFLGNPFGGGFVIDDSGLREPEDEVVSRMLLSRLSPEHNELIDSLQDRLTAMATGREGFNLSMVERCVKQLPVIAIRKYAYEHALMYYMERTGIDEEAFEGWCDRIELLVQGFSSVQYMAIKMGMTGKKELLDPILQRLDEMNERELAIKGELARLHGLWLSRLESGTSGRAGAAS